MPIKSVSRADSEPLKAGLETGDAKILTCNICGKTVSSELPEDVAVRAWVECVDCAQSFEKRPAERKKTDAPTGFTARALFGKNGERSVTEQDYENLVQRIVDLLRKQKDNLPLVIIVK